MPENKTQSTETMLSKLKEAHEIKDFIEENTGAFYNSTIRDHFDMLFKKYNVIKKEVIRRSNIERGYAYQILRGVKEAKRDKYIRLAIGIGLNLEDTQHLLTVTRHGILYPKILRDAVIIFSIDNRLDVLQLELLLEEQQVDPLE